MARHSRKRDYPAHAYSTLRDFQIAKRKDLRAVRKAFADFRFASAWVPGFEEHVDELGKQLDALHEKMRPGNWK